MTRTCRNDSLVFVALNLWIRVQICLLEMYCGPEEWLLVVSLINSCEIDSMPTNM